MRKTILLATTALLAYNGYAQVPEDALRLSWNTSGGTARNQAVGGVGGSLGGDLSANYINPAGLGFFKTSEFVLTTGFNFINNKSDYRGTGNNSKDNNFFLGTSGFVFGFSNAYKPGKSSAFSIAINRTADFNNNIYYSGQNNFSSFTEQYAAEIAASGVDIGDAPGSNRLSFPARMASYTYLVDTLTVGNGIEVVGTPMRYAFERDTAFLLNQENSIVSSGGINEIAISLASNNKDRFFFGGSLGIPIVNYSRTITYTETDASNNPRNYFNSASLREEYSTKGVGVNLKLGMIFRPVDYIRIGAAIHTPSIYALRDNYFAELRTNTENYNQVSNINTDNLPNGGAPQYEYDLTSPWKFMVSGSYVFREVADTRQQKGFLSADLEYVTYSSNRYRTSEDLNGSSQEYYDAVNNVIREVYKGALNFRLGGELKFNTIMARAGFSYYGNPYADSELNGKRMYMSGGLGYRDKGFFIDLTYAHRLTDDVSFPYRLPDKANTFSEIRGSGGNVVLTAGIKF
ncbi:aromatic hydrocarbon degradation protein [Flavihumibacter rivuli]|uniref:OmpP1/FadL family transporter n=1 Tax=Flavihumibacter rivuli TaxID=2838156 RepID=UPI001BDE4573|nr:aromatic hydrocarbon degradation protein [Flavihumibacter rivuli]ULQ57200.1 aromatic hydrocarbon degradation protein [Flavihumibacter rivuli]